MLCGGSGYMLLVVQFGLHVSFEREKKNPLTICQFYSRLVIAIFIIFNHKHPWFNPAAGDLIDRYRPVMQIIVIRHKKWKQ